MPKLTQYIVLFYGKFVKRIFMQMETFYKVFT